MTAVQVVAEGERIVRRAYTRQQRHQHLATALAAIVAIAWAAGIVALTVWAAIGVFG